ncbi:ABC transporter permease [Leifsonia poae]|uniref:ABC transporter permease n=1 Tax=Leifsonia poae TaxID=110933 RepID=A0A9W6M045_9MICO|nr:ABC transporter permease [Leifsonia poae]GLJ76963.1 ABC transporter permease [Leifsonia poae]
MPILSELAPTLLGVLLLAAVATAVLAAYRVPRRWAPLLAILRGALQLAVISLILAGVITNPLWVAAALLVMFCVAAATATRRIGWSRDHALMMGSAMAAGIAVTLVIVFTTGAIAFSSRYVLAIGGIIIGNSMSIATLAGRRFTEGVNDHWDEVEGWLALGATPRQSTLELARGAVYGALIPSVDQTKTTGLVTLPGAFVGAIFGGVSPLEAGRFQVVVLAAIMAAGSITAVLVAYWLAPVKVRPVRLS